MEETKLPLFVVKVHYALRAESAEAARAEVIEACEASDYHVEGLETQCVDNLEEVERVPEPVQNIDALKFPGFEDWHPETEVRP